MLPPHSYLLLVGVFIDSVLMKANIKNKIVGKIVLDFVNQEKY